ncbi:MAG: hypothetical protein D6687_07425 [Acidobacteria bacterium]|jgi:hypothetical protein|nr:MAG: hypothetical protein D6687_07425 [Acidobacteriota bacterium]GIU81664.1 MAG: hypothetical protein KatS3mg006_0728 [Pyrinomonadaceae bacterium]
MKHLILTLFLCVFLFAPSVFAHGDEHHGEEQKVSSSSNAEVIANVLRLDDYEILLKYPPLLPDTQTSAKLFITKYETNEPINAALEVEIERNDGLRYQVQVEKGKFPGSYELKFPALEEGKYTVLAKIISREKTNTATFPIEVKANSLNMEQKSDENYALLALVALTSILFAIGFYLIKRITKDKLDPSVELR